jgi:hypothetical protein
MQYAIGSDSSEESSADIREKSNFPQRNRESDTSLSSKANSIPYSVPIPFFIATSVKDQ